MCLIIVYCEFTICRSSIGKVCNIFHFYLMHKLYIYYIYIYVYDIIYNYIYIYIFYLSCIWEVKSAKVWGSNLQFGGVYLGN